MCNVCGDAQCHYGEYCHPIGKSVRYDVCECGDYRHQHYDGSGKCLLNELGHGGAPNCTKFRLSQPMETPMTRNADDMGLPPPYAAERLRCPGLATRVDELEAALRAVIRDVNEYERVNNLHPNPGRSECWDSVATAKNVLAKGSY